MITFLRHKYFQFIERWQQEGFLVACWFYLYKCDEEVPVARDLATLRPAKEPAGILPVILDLGPDNFDSHELHYPLRSHQEEVKRYLLRGYRAFVMVRDGVVIGNLWYVTRTTSRLTRLHPHLQWYGIDLGPHEVYMFDMYVDPKERGNSLTTWFMTSALLNLRNYGYDKAYGSFNAHNLPALWVHRLIGYEEKSHVMVRRFLIYKTAHAKD